MFVFTREEILKKSQLKQKALIRRRKWLGGGFIGLVSLALLAILATFYFSPNAYAVMLNGQQIALVENESVIEEALKMVAPDSDQACYLEELELQEVKADPDDLLSLEEVKNLLSQKLTWTIDGAVINLNGKDIVTLESEQVAQEVLKEVEKAFYPVDATDVKNVKVVINDDINIRKKQVEVNEVCSFEEAKKLLLGTQEEVEVYTVKEGDNLWTIARRNDMRVADIRRANPELTSENLSIGQVLKLTQAVPLINVTTTYEQQVKEKIPFDTKTVKDSSILRGQSKVKQPGEEGEKQVQYKIVMENGRQVTKEVLQEQVLKEPVQKVVLQGTKLVMASRGSGQLSWPLKGRITSSYGKRGREFHTGMDIDGRTGDSIRAAESGKVTQAGWVGNYGYMVTINHGDGLVTRYAHCSKLLVKVGDQVSRGDVIAKVGSTGRSTGSHLHFEVIVNGKFQNPRLFL
ncbi:MAG: peptidoglycan DD-metalloendopeptidase family protein [Zhaonellaceae bacterium]|nr:peptidoglycan DD-metalloendopeptidase family protein [Clostridia bacterium]